MTQQNITTVNGPMTLIVKEMPDEVFEWQCRSRIKSLTSIIDGEPFGNFGPHLPTMSVLNAGGDFAINSAAKGVGLVPKPEYLETYTSSFENLIEDSIQKGWKVSMPDRLAALKNFYNQPERIDRTAFGSLELYQKRTYSGVCLDPRCSLLFVDIDVDCISYEIHVIAELHKPGSPVHRFETAIHDLFHVPNSCRKVYPFAYLMLVVEVYDKSPGPRASTRLL